MHYVATPSWRVVSSTLMRMAGKETEQWFAGRRDEPHASYPKEINMDLTTEEFRRALAKLLSTGEELGFTAVDVNAGNLHRRVGGYPGEDHRMPMCCEAMRQTMISGDVVVNEPPSGQGASLTIRYCLPRTK